MKTRKQIVELIINSGNKIGTFEDVVIDYYVDVETLKKENILIELIGDDELKIHYLCPRYDGDMEDVDIKEYNKYRKSKKWKTLTDYIKNKYNNKCHFCGSEKRLAVHHHNYINLYNETEKDLVCVCGQCHMKIHMGCSCNGSENLCNVCKFSKENYTIMYNYLISEERNSFGAHYARKKHNIQ